MPRSYDDILAELNALSPLPEGYSMKWDELTDNILVDGPRFGFTVSRKAIDDNLYKKWHKPTLDLLIAFEKYASESGCDPVKYDPIIYRSSDYPEFSK